MGWKYRVKKVLLRVCAVHQSIFYRLDRTLVPEAVHTANSMLISSEEVSVEDIIRDLYDNNHSEWSFYHHYMRQGIEHWQAQTINHVIGVVWLYTGYYLKQWEGYQAWLLHVKVEPSAKFVCNVFVSPQHRGQGIFPLIVKRCFLEYPDSAFYSCVDSVNLPSRRSHEKMGFRQCAAAYYVRLFQITFCCFVTQSGKHRLFKMPKGKEVNVSLIDR